MASKDEWAKALREWQSVATQKPFGTAIEKWTKHMDYQRHLSQVTKTQVTPKQDNGDESTHMATSATVGQLELQQAEDRLRWAEQMHRKGYVSDGQLAAERLELESVKIRQAEDRLKQAEGKNRKGEVSAAQVTRERDALRKLEAARAQSDLSRAKDRLEWAEQMFKKGYVSKAQKVSEELNYRKARNALEQSQYRLGRDERHGDAGRSCQ